MGSKSLLLTLIILISSMAGCTGDPDAGGNDEFSIEAIQGLIDNSTLDLISNMTEDPVPTLYYMNGDFGYWGEDYEYDQGVWTEVQNNHWTWVGTPANWIEVANIHQKEHEMIELRHISFHGYLNNSIGDMTTNSIFGIGSGSYESVIDWGMNCSNGFQNELSSNEWNSFANMPDSPGEIFPMAGEECDYTLSFKSNYEWSHIWWTVIYTVTEITEIESTTDIPEVTNNATNQQNEQETNVSMMISFVPGGMDEESRTTVMIELEMYMDESPIHVRNFLGHVVNGNYNSTVFHRIIDGFMIQGGDIQGLGGSGGYAVEWYGYCNGQAMESSSGCDMTDWTIPDEADNGLYHTPGAISMAKTSSPNTGGSQFFIVPSDSVPSHLDGVHTVFGYVTSGLDSITEISEVDTGSNDAPIHEVRIESITLG